MEIGATTMCQFHASGADRCFMLLNSVFAETYHRQVHFSLESFFSVTESWRQFSDSHSAIPGSLPGDSPPQQDKLSCLIQWHRLTLVLYQSHTPSRLACGIGIGLPSFDVQSFSRRPDTGFIGTNPSGNGVLACRQIAAVMSALGKASHVFAID